jgi:hypothetical protein
LTVRFKFLESPLLKGEIAACSFAIPLNHRWDHIWDQLPDV